MTTKSGVKERREKIAELLAKSVTSIKEISNMLGIPYNTVDNDIRWLKGQKKPRQLGLAQIGYAYECKIKIDKLIETEWELEEMLEEAKKRKVSTYKELAILKKLTKTLMARFNIECKVLELANNYDWS